jgi:DNA-binding transcriptional regulator YiaG
MLLCGATSVSPDSIEWPLDFYITTNAGLSNSLFKVVPPSAMSALQEIKSTTGLTWQQFSRVFKVSQRSLHLWMDGEALDSIHQERLYRVLTTIRRLPFSESFQNRIFLLSPQADGTIPLDLLATGDNDTFLARASGTPVRAIAGTSVSDDRRPLPPSTLMDAMQDRLHVDLPGRRAVKAVKRKGT